MKKQRSTGIQMIIVLIICISCSTAPVTEKNVEVREVNSISGLSDSSFFSNVHHISFYEDQYFIPDYNTHMVYQCTGKFGLVRKFGGIGKGPGDLNTPNTVIPKPDRMYVFEEMNQRISIFDRNARFIKSVPNDFYADLGSCAFIDDSANLFIMSQGPAGPLVKINLDSGSKTYFGNFKPFKTKGERRDNNQYHALLSGDLLLAVSLSDPRIDIYKTASLKKISSFTFDNLAVVRSRTEFAASEAARDPENSSSTYLLVADACLYKNRLYLLLYDNLNGKVPDCNKVACFDVRNDKITYRQTYCLINKDDNKWYSSLTINSSAQIVAFSPLSSKFYFFNL